MTDPQPPTPPHWPYSPPRAAGDEHEHQDPAGDEHEDQDPAGDEHEHQDPAGDEHEDQPELHVGQIVEHTTDDIPSGQTVTTVGIVTDVTDDGVYVAPLSAAAVVPADQLRAL